MLLVDLGQNEGAHVVDVMRRQGVGLELRLDQQRRDRLPDLLQPALELRHRLVRKRFPAAVAPVGAQRGKHAAQRVVDFMGDPGGQAPEGGEALGRYHLPFDVAFLSKVLKHRPEPAGEPPDLVMGSDRREYDLLGREGRDLGHAVGQMHERGSNPAPPTPGERDECEQNRGPHRATHDLVQGRQQARARIDEDDAPEVRTRDFDGHNHQQAVARLIFDRRRSPAPVRCHAILGRAVRESCVLEPCEDRELLGPA